jgi:XTP/dITP diphosphohydrolase
LAEHRRFDGRTIVIASHNVGKVREFTDLLAPLGAEVRSAAELKLAEPAETGTTFRANAEIKAIAAANATGLAALADDSGLQAVALNGDPGIHSARWAGRRRDFRVAMERLERKLDGEDDRGARFVCALSLAWPDSHCETFEGHVPGTLIWPPRGDQGFGYDPVFVPRGHKVTFAEMVPAEKHAISHRADAFSQLITACFSGV